MESILRSFADAMNRPEVVIFIALIAGLFCIVLAILWLILPFAVFGTKKRLEDIISENQKTNTWLEALAVEHQKMNSWLAEIMSESKRTTAWLAEMKTAPQPPEAPTVQENNPTGVSEDPLDKRTHPRLDFRCTGRIMGRDVAIADLSLGGLFIEMEDPPELLKAGQVTNVDLDLPTEVESLRLKVKIVNQNERGIGCKFVDLSPENRESINSCFDEFKNTLPILDSDDL